MPAPERRDHDGRIYHLEHENERHSKNIHRLTDVVHTTVIRLSVLEAKAAIWGAFFGAVAGGVIALVIRHL